jgi:hypothetical protein
MRGQSCGKIERFRIFKFSHLNMDQFVGATTHMHPNAVLIFYILFATLNECPLER